MHIADCIIPLRIYSLGVSRHMQLYGMMLHAVPAHEQIPYLILW